MARIVPQKQTKFQTPPSWVDPEALRRASQPELSADAQMTQHKDVKNTSVKTVVSYACTQCSKTFGNDHPHFHAQKNLAIRKASLDGKAVGVIKLSCPACGSEVVPYKTSGVNKANLDPRFAAQFASGVRGTYNTVVDRHIVYKAVQAMQDYSEKQGMSMARARFIKASHEKEAGKEYPMLNNIECEIEWTMAPRQKARVFATMGVDEAGKFRFPRVFKTADKKEYPFDKETIQSIEKSADLFRVPSDPKLKKTDTPQYRKTDPTRYKAASLSKEGEPSLKAEDVVRRAMIQVNSLYSGLSQEGQSAVAQFNSLSQNANTKEELLSLAQKLFSVKYPDNASMTSEKAFADHGDGVRAAGSLLLYHLGMIQETDNDKIVSALLEGEKSLPFAQQK